MHWLTTLRGQFVTVVFVGVILSSIAVIAILETARVGEIRRVRTVEISDRVAASFELIADLGSPQREGAVNALNSRFFNLSIVGSDPLANYVMNAEEARFAAGVKAGQDNENLGPVRVRVPPGAFDEQSERRSSSRDDDTPRLNVRSLERIEISQALGTKQWIKAAFDPPQSPRQAPDMLIGAVLAALLSSVAAAWMARRVSRPLSALASAADEVARGNTAPFLKPDGPNDIRIAAQAFNAMSDRVTKTLESHRQLLSAVGHDLRTPLAAMRITAEFVNDEEVRDRLTRNLDELQSLTEAVLSAVRSERGEEMRRVDLGSLIQSVCDDLIDLGEPVEVDITASAPCLCRPSEIRRAVRNLIENAVRYGGGAHVTLKSEGDNFVAIIDDSGPGIPHDKLEQVFEPFTRLEESRSNSTGGSGLGLTLARAIAREHGGDVVLQNRRGGGLRANLRLPREGRATQGTISATAGKATHS